jgi:hypothetical protein
VPEEESEWGCVCLMKKRGRWSGKVAKIEACCYCCCVLTGEAEIGPDSQANGKRERGRASRPTDSYVVAKANRQPGGGPSVSSTADHLLPTSFWYLAVRATPFL